MVPIYKSSQVTCSVNGESVPLLGKVAITIEATSQLYYTEFEKNKYYTGKSKK